MLYSLDSRPDIIATTELDWVPILSLILICLIIIFFILIHPHLQEVQLFMFNKVLKAFPRPDLIIDLTLVESCSVETYLILKVTWKYKCNYYTSDSLWKTWLVESIQSIHNSLWTWRDKCNICCRYCIYHVNFNVCLVTKPLGVFSSETEWLNASLLFLRMNYVD